MASIPENYYSILARIESNNNPNAKSSTSSASGLYQFLKGTFTSLGFNWDDRFNVATQQKAAEKFTNQNAAVLSRNGVEVNNSTLYAAHFLGASTASKVLRASGSADLSTIVGENVINANSFLKGYTVKDFIDWLNNKTGSASREPSSPGDISDDKPSLSNLGGLLTYRFASRITAVSLGIAFIIIAIVAFLFTSDAGKQAVSSVTKIPVK